MHIVSEASLKRPGHTYNAHGIGLASESDPSINWKHIDGPLLYTSQGRLHWLTWWERIQMHFGWTTIDKLNWKHHRHIERELSDDPRLTGGWMK